MKSINKALFLNCLDNGFKNVVLFKLKGIQRSFNES